MKKFLLSLLAILCIGGMANAAEQSFTITFKSGTTTSDSNSAFSTSTTIDSFVEENCKSLISGIESTNNTYLGKKDSGIKFSSSSKNGSITLKLESAAQVLPTKVSINAARWKSSEAASVSFNGTSVDLTSDAFADYTCTPSTSVPITTISLAATKRLYVRSITVYYNDAPASIGWTAENATVYLNDENNKFPTFNNPDNLFVIYDSSDKNVATIDDEGNITLVGTGTTTISALDENDAEYTYTLVVERKLDTIFDNNLLNNQGDFTIEDILVGEGLSAVWTTNNNGMTANGYVSGNAHEADSWLISPVIDLRYATETTMSFEHGVNYFTDIETAKTETSFNIREEGGDWEIITIPYPETLGNGFISTQAISLAQYEGKKIQLGFHYTSGATKSGRWQIKNVLVQGFVDEPTLPEGALDFTTVDVEDSFTIGKDEVSADITITGVHAESELYYKFTKTPAVNPEAAPRKIVDHTGYTKVEPNSNGTHTVTVSEPGTLELYAYHPATDSKSEIKTITVTKASDTTAIDEIGADVVEGEAEYFNLQGVKINPENAAPGLYIRRQGGKVAKVMVK